jgi:hypothetical protein
MLIESRHVTWLVRRRAAAPSTVIYPEPAFVAPFECRGNARIDRFGVRIEDFAPGSGLSDDRGDAGRADAARVH